MYRREWFFLPPNTFFFIFKQRWVCDLLGVGQPAKLYVFSWFKFKISISSSYIQHSPDFSDVKTNVGMAVTGKYLIPSLLDNVLFLRFCRLCFSSVRSN